LHRLCHDKLLAVIQQNNFFDNCLANKNTIINTIVSEDSNLKKQNIKTVNIYKKKLSDALKQSKNEKIIQSKINKFSIKCKYIFT